MSYYVPLVDRDVLFNARIKIYPNDIFKYTVFNKLIYNPSKDVKIGTKILASIMNTISKIFILKLIKKIKSLNNIKGIKTKLENIIFDLKIVLISTGIAATTNKIYSSTANCSAPLSAYHHIGSSCHTRPTAP